EHWQRAKVGAINFHDGPLPRYAGINGSAWALLRGEARHAIVWHRLAEGIDTGAILARREVEIEARETSLSLNIKNAALAHEAFGALLDELERGATLTGAAQPAGERLVFSRHDRPAALGTIDVHDDATAIDALVRACDWGPYANRFASAKIVHELRGADGHRAGGALIVRAAQAIAWPTTDVQPGTVLEIGARSFTVACGTGALRVDRVAALDGGDVAISEGLHALGLGVGDAIVDERRAERAARSRGVAEAEPQLTRRLVALDPPQLPFAASINLSTSASASASENESESERAIPVAVHGLSLDPLRERFADRFDAAAVAAFVFAIASQCDRDHVHAALARPHADDDDDEAVLFAPTVPLLFHIDARAGFRAFVDATTAELHSAHKLGPFLADLVARTPALASQRRLARGALSSVGLVLDECNGDARLPPGATVALCVGRDGARLLVDERAVEDARARTLLQQIEAVARTVARDPERALSSVDLLDDAQRARQLFSWNDTAAPFRDDILIHTLFEERVRDAPHRVAVVCDGASLTFRELDARANRVARALQSRGVKRGDFVAFVLARDLDLVATMIGVSKSGASYVPVDQAYPAERARFMLDDARAVLVLTSSSLLSSSSSSS
ncbi:MAG TPA: AMP-binding protein, partial [Myxococcota bacterium]